MYVPLALLFLWAQLYLATIPIWRFGEYYTYGWFVPPLAAILFARRWQDPTIKATPPLPTPTLKLLVLALILLPCLFLLRSVSSFDPSWRPAILAQALLVIGATHLILAWSRGWKTSLFLVPVTIYALSAIPYPWQFEQILIRKLTGGVMHISAELFNLFGRPVTVIGEKLESMGTVVEVTEGCSGIRSFQNLIMAAFFFGELFRLKWIPRLLLLLIGIAASVVMNTGRAMTLARIRFDDGEAAFDAAHDNVGFISFLLSASVLLIAARFFSDRSSHHRKIIRRTTVSPQT